MSREVLNILDIKHDSDENINPPMGEKLIEPYVGEIIEYCDDYCYFKCPNCSTYIVVFLRELNCKIFRCGVYKNNNEPINPHTSKELCDKLKNEDLIYGCSKPFIVREKHVEKCDYI
jgi:hypothetical protein